MRPRRDQRREREGKRQRPSPRRRRAYDQRQHREEDDLEAERGRAAERRKHQRAPQQRRRREQERERPQIVVPVEDEELVDGRVGDEQREHLGAHAAGAQQREERAEPREIGQAEEGDLRPQMRPQPGRAVCEEDPEGAVETVTCAHRVAPPVRDDRVRTVEGVRGRIVGARGPQMRVTHVGVEVGAGRDRREHGGERHHQRCSQRPREQRRFVTSILGGRVEPASASTSARRSGWKKAVRKRLP